MTVQMFSHAKALFARRELDWRASTATAHLVDATYLPLVEVDRLFPPTGLEAAILATVALTNRTVDDTGWCTADPVVFVGAVLARPCGQAVIAVTDPASAELALLLLEFPQLPAKATPDTYSLLFAQRGPGWFRL